MGEITIRHRASRLIVESKHLNVDAAVPTQHTCPSGRWAYSQLSPKLQSSEDSLQMNREPQIETGFGFDNYESQITPGAHSVYSYSGGRDCSFFG